MKAWAVTEPQEGYLMVVWADTRGKARATAFRELDDVWPDRWKYTDMAVRRVPSLDGDHLRPDGRLRRATARERHEAGGWHECHECWRRTDKASGGVAVDDWRILCSRCNEIAAKGGLAS